MNLGAEALWGLEVESGWAQPSLLCADAIERASGQLLKWAKGQDSCTKPEGHGQTAAQLQEQPDNNS